MAAGGKIKKTKVYAGSGNSGQRVEKQTRKAGVDQWEEKTAKEKRQYVMPQSAPALQPQPTKRTTPTVPQGPVTKAKDDQTRALVNGTVRAAPQGAITKSQADAAIEVLLAPTRKNAFPSAGLNTQRRVTDQFLKQPSGTERADAAIKALNPIEGAMTAGDAAVNITGAGARERMAAQEEAASRSRSLQEAARKAALAGNTQALQAVQKQQEADMQTMGGGTLLDFLWGKLGNNSENDVSRNLRQQKEEAIETLTQGLTPGESTLANIGLQGANMLVNQAVAAGMGLPLPVYNAITQGGAAGQEALDQGYSPEQAAGLAAGSGAISYGIEKMGGVAGDWGDTLLKKAAGTKVGQALLSKVPQKVMDFLGSVSKNKAAQVLGTGLEEGFENFTEYDLQRLWRNLMLDESTPYDIRQAMSEAASGVLFGSVMAGVPALSDAARTKYGDWQEGRAWKQEDWGRLLEEASRSENPAVRQDAADIVSRMSQGKDPSAADLGALARRGRASGVLDEDAGLLLTMRPLDERGAWAAKSKKEYDLDKNGERIRLPSGRYKTHKVDLTGWNNKDNTLLWRKAWADYGIPREQIAFIHEANTETRKKELFAKVRSGQVRVLMGSTFKMGAGMNVQDRLVALHDLDCPWRPGDLEQRSGRIIRQGNRNKEVHIYRYVTESTFDAYLWQTVENICAFFWGGRRQQHFACFSRFRTLRNRYNGLASA